MIIEQVIYSRYEYTDTRPSEEIFNEYDSMFEKKYCPERGITVGGVSVAINVSSKRVIVLTYDKEAEAFMRLKFYGRKDVSVTRCIT